METSQLHHEPPRPRHRRSRPVPPSTRHRRVGDPKVERRRSRTHPSGHYPANAAWFACADIAHNLGRWAIILAKQDPISNRTLRTRIVAVAAVSVNRSRRHTLRLPTRWPWQDDFTTMLETLRALPGPAG